MNPIEKIRGKLIGFGALRPFDNFIQLCVERSLFTQTQSVIHRIDGMEVLIDYAAGEQNGTRSCVGDLQYEPFVLEMKLDGPLNVLDLGANGGGFALMLKRLRYELRKVVAVELNPRTYGRLCFNLHRNLDCEVRALHAGVAERDGSIELALGGGSIGDSIFMESEGPGPRTRVPLIALSSLIQQQVGSEPIDVCKIDIEGAEFPILVSEEGAALRHARHLIIEIHSHPDYSEQWVHDRLAGWGFELLPARSSFEPNVFGYRRKDFFQGT